MMQQLQREAATMGPLVDSLVAALLDLVITAISEECDEEQVQRPRPVLKRRIHVVVVSTSTPRLVYCLCLQGAAVKAQAMCLSDSEALLEAVQRVRGLETRGGWERDLRASVARTSVAREDDLPQKPSLFRSGSGGGGTFGGGSSDGATLFSLFCSFQTIRDPSYRFFFQKCASQFKL